MLTLLEALLDILQIGVDLFTPDSGGTRRSRKNTRSQMPLIEIQDLPDTSRVWVFGADHELDAGATDLLLREVDRFLSQWHAHGAPLTSARAWRYGRFLTIAVDQSTAGASGCSIDGLYRNLKALESRLGGSLVTSGLVFYRDGKGHVQAVDRDRFSALGAEGQIKADTRVFDPTVTTLGEWRARFELNAEDSWHSRLVGKKQPA
jgi:hypothetical protein